MSRMVAGGGSSMNKDHDELWLCSFDLRAYAKIGMLTMINKSRKKANVYGMVKAYL
jgi:hypothetical protein